MSSATVEDAKEYLDRMRSIAFRAQRKEREAREVGRGIQQRDRAFLLGQLREAQPWEYGAWLKGYLLKGGSPTHYYDYPTPTTWVALADLDVRPLYGAGALTAVIIPAGLRAAGETGHTNLYFMDGYRHQGFHDTGPGVPRMVSVYADTELP